MEARGKFLGFSGRVTLNNDRNMEIKFVIKLLKTFFGYPSSCGAVEGKVDGDEVEVQNINEENGLSESERYKYGKLT